MTGRGDSPRGRTDSRRLRVLIAEDSEDDALLLMRHLRRGGFQALHHRVESVRGLRAALNDGAWDLIITDYNMPQFSSDDVLAAVRDHGIDVPIILVSAHVADARAADAMKAGIHDYVLKDNLSRLAPAVERELREARNRQAHRQATAELEHVVWHDTLTGLANRMQVEKRLGAVLDGVDERGHAFLLLDLDRFHLVNDTGGHPAGDELIRRLASALTEHVHESDTLGRVGPDEFGVLLERCPLSPAWRIAERLRQVVADCRLRIDDRSFQVTTSIGLVPITNQGQNVADVLRRADLACRAAKDLGRDRIRVYSDKDEYLTRRHGDMEWVARLREGLEEGDFVLYRQPIQSLASSRQEVFSELLLRLTQPDGSLVEPGRFIPAAERFDMMPLIDRWVIRRAFEQIAAAGAADPTRRWFINLSGRSLSDESLPVYVRTQLAVCGIAPERVCFELTETAAITHMNVALRFMREVRALGCAVALDDFGSGLSSFNYLKSLPADFLKIDGSFVRLMLDHSLDHTIVESVTRIGHAAGMEVIAEMAETDAVIPALADIGVDYAQGHALGYPVPFGAGSPTVSPVAKTPTDYPV